MRFLLFLLLAGCIRSCATRTKDPAEGDAAGSRVSLRWPEAQLATALAVGALEAAIEDARAHLALVVTLEQRAAAALIAPPIARLVGRAI